MNDRTLLQKAKADQYRQAKLEIKLFDTAHFNKNALIGELQ